MMMSRNRFKAGLQKVLKQASKKFRIDYKLILQLFVVILFQSRYLSYKQVKNRLKTG
jgi:hypothetical protein